MQVYSPGGRGAELRLGGCGQGPRAPKRAQKGGGTKGKVGVPADGILKVCVLKSSMCVFVLMLNGKIRMLNSYLL